MRPPVLFRLIASYTPATLTSGGVAIVFVIAFTRLFAPEQYGYYALGITIAMFGQVYLFQGLDMAVARLLPQATKEGREATFLGTCALLFVFCLVLAGGLCLLATSMLDLSEELRRVAWASLPLLGVRSLTSLRLVYHRARLSVLRHNMLECGQSVCSLVLALAATHYIGANAVVVLLAVALGVGLVISLDLLGTLPRVSMLRFDLSTAKQIARFTLPLTFSFGMAYILTSADRFYIQIFMGSAVLGSYTVAFTLVDRLTSLVFMVTAMSSFPLAVRALEENGRTAAQSQLYQNGAVTLALAVPACIGLIPASGAIANVFIGSEFREAVANLLPWLAVSAILQGIRVHYLEHALHLARRTDLLAICLGVSAMISLALNVVLIPKFGIYGAVYTAMTCNFLAAAIAFIVGQKTFPYPFPFGPAIKVIGAALCMAVLVRLLGFAPTPIGLAATVFTGAVTYALLALYLDVAGLGKFVRKFLLQRG